MRIDELTRPETDMGVDLLLRRAGYENLGHGSFANVYQKPGKPYVLKVFTSEDTGYLAYLDLIRKHQDNPHFPKIYGKLVSISPEYYAVRMEPLQKYVYGAQSDYVDVQDISIYLNHWDQPIVPGYVEGAREFMEENPLLQEACDLIIEHLVGRFTLDMSKPENTMLRGTTVVITDPIWDHRDKKKRRSPDVRKWGSFSKRPVPK